MVCGLSVLTLSVGSQHILSARKKDKAVSCPVRCVCPVPVTAAPCRMFPGQPVMRQMEKQVYITEEERAKCQKVTDAFAELYEMEKIVVLDAGRYGFVELKYYKPPHGFEEDATFTDGRALFDALWQEWFNTTLYLTAKKMQLDNIIYEEVFNCLSKEKQSSIIAKKADFARKAGITL